MVDLTPDFHRRDCSLPMGCKDLLDVLNLTDEVFLEEPVSVQPQTSPAGEKKAPLSEDDAAKKPVEIGEHIKIKSLAALLHCKPYQILGQLIKFHVFKANDDALLTFEEAERVALQMGFEVRRLN